LTGTFAGFSSSATAPEKRTNAVDIYWTLSSLPRRNNKQRAEVPASPAVNVNPSKRPFACRHKLPISFVVWIASIRTSLSQAFAHGRFLSRWWCTGTYRGHTGTA